MLAIEFFLGLRYAKQIDVATNDKPFSVFVKLVEVISDFLRPRLYGEICLPKSDDFFSWVAILDDEITGIACKRVVNDGFFNS